MIGNRSTRNSAAGTTLEIRPAARGWNISDAVRRGRKAWLVGCLSALALGAVGIAHADLTGPSPKDRQITLQIAQYLRKAHLTQHRLDDEISRRWLDNFLKTLDPMKVYFYQGDIDNFRKSENELDNMANRGDISFAYEIFKVYLARLTERSELAVQLLAEPHDFAVEEALGTDPKKAEYAKDFAQAREIWRKRVKYDILQQKVDNKLDDAKAREKLARRYHSLPKRLAQTSNDELLEMYLTAMTTAFDPHTSYMAPETLDNFRILMSLQLDGIGASLRSEDGQTIVTEVVPGGAAQKHGKLKPEDVVVGVGQGEAGEIEEVVDQKLGDVVNKIRGKRGTIVRLKVVPAGKSEPVVYNIIRDKIELKGSEARGEVIEFGQKPNNAGPYKVGVINLPSFYMDMVAAQNGEEDFKSTTRDVLKLIEDPKTGFKAQGVDVIIMDLRQNGGGSLSEAIKLTGLFIDKGPVVQVKDWEGEVNEHDDTDAGVAWDKPLVVLCSKFSASASEIFAGAIQDYNRGLIVGDTSTHGKGTVQSLLDMSEGIGGPANAYGALKLTMQQFYRPNGHSTQREGVESDVVLPSVVDHMDVGEADLDYAVPFDQIDPAPFKAVGDVNDAMRKQLGVQSAQRVQQSADFQKIIRDVEKYLARKDRKEVSLNEAKFRADRADLESEKNADPDEPPKSYDRPVVERDAYFNETLQITLDYLRLMSVARTR